MKQILKAVTAASAFLVASQAHATDFIVANQTAGNQHTVANQSASSYFSLTGSDATGASANLGNSPTQAGSFTDNYFFAPSVLNAIGSGSATSNNSVNLTFLANLGLTITGYSLVNAPAAVAAALLDGFTSSDYTGDLATLNNYLATNPLVTYSQPGTKVPNGSGEQVQLTDVTLSSDNFYVITVKGTQNNTILGRYDGNVAYTAVPAVPEPATWAMLLVGFGAVGYTMRRRRAQQNVAVSFA